MQNSINIREYIEIFKRRKIVVMFILIIFLSRGAYLTYKNEKAYVPIFKSIVSVRINNLKTYSEPEGDDENSDNNRATYGYSLSNSSLNQNIATSYSSLATSKRAMQEVIKNLDLSITPEALASKITVVQQEKIPEFIDITVRDTDFQLTQRIASQVPAAFNNELIKVIGLDCVEQLFEASEPTLVQKPIDITIIKYGLAGIIISIFIALLLECLDNKIVTPDDVEKYWEAPLVGMIPYDNGKGIGRVTESDIKRVRVNNKIEI